jgi:hypothetical protein
LSNDVVKRRVNDGGGNGPLLRGPLPVCVSKDDAKDAYRLFGLTDNYRDLAGDLGVNVVFMRPLGRFFDPSIAFQPLDDVSCLRSYWRDCPPLFVCILYISFGVMQAALCVLYMYDLREVAA